MKLFIGAITLLAISSTATASESACAIKQKNAASFALAQSYGVKVQDVHVNSYTPGSWTEAMGNNVGSDQVLVSTTVNEKISVADLYEVSARQIGTSADCEILSVTSKINSPKK